MADGPFVVPFPERPRLSNTVLARRHLVNGVETIVLHEWRTHTVLEIDPPSFEILTQADGTRDLDALCLACARLGMITSVEDITSLLRELNELGVLEDGLMHPRRAAPVEPPVTPSDRPVVQLPGYTFRCNGAGSCCRFYGAVVFDPIEAGRAQGIADKLELPFSPKNAFTPLRGAQSDHRSDHQSDHAQLAVAQVDGRCLFLDQQNHCQLHIHGGAEGKPFPCRAYPAVLIDDGETVRASVIPECACVFESALDSEGEPILGDDFSLDAYRFPVRHLPDPVPLSATRTATRVEARVWATHFAERLTDDRLEIDAAVLAFQLAAVVEEEGLSIDALEAALRDPRELDHATSRRWLAALRETAKGGETIQASWRSASDLSRQVASWVARALESMPTDGSSGSTLKATDPLAERFYLRSLAHAHRLSVDGLPLAHGLRDRGTRILTARAMALADPPVDTASAYPLALLEAGMRNLGLGTFANVFLQT